MTSSQKARLRKFYQIKRIINAQMPPGFVTIPGPYFLSSPVYAVRTDPGGIWYLFTANDLQQAADTIASIVDRRCDAKTAANAMLAKDSGFRLHKKGEDFGTNTCWSLHAEIGNKIISAAQKAAYIAKDDTLIDTVREMKPIADMCSAYSQIDTYNVAVSLAFCAEWAFNPENIIKETSNRIFDFTELEGAVRNLLTFEGFVQNMPRLLPRSMLDNAQHVRLNILPIDRYAYSLISPFAFGMTQIEAEQRAQFMNSLKNKRDNTHQQKKPNLVHTILEQPGVAKRIVNAVFSPTDAGFEFDAEAEYAQLRDTPSSTIITLEDENHVIEHHIQAIALALANNDAEYIEQNLEDMALVPVAASKGKYTVSTTSLPEGSCLNNLVYGTNRLRYHTDLVHPNEQSTPTTDAWSPGDTIF